MYIRANSSLGGGGTWEQLWKNPNGESVDYTSAETSITVGNISDYRYLKFKSHGIAGSSTNLYPEIIVDVVNYFSTTSGGNSSQCPATIFKGVSGDVFYRMFYYDTSTTIKTRSNHSSNKFAPYEIYGMK